MLFARERFAPDLPWSELRPLLPGWEITACPPPDVSDHLDGVDVLCPFWSPVTPATLGRARLGLVQQFGVGLDKVALDAATDAGVWVCRLPGDRTGNADSVADLAVLHVLAALRRLDEARAAPSRGGWGEPMGRSLLGTTTLLVGLGAIGTAVARRLAGFGTRLVGVRAHPERGGPPEVSEVLGPDALPAALATADVVVCGALAGPDNRHLFDARAFAAVRPGAVFVNVARGSLVDEDALLAALDSGRLAAAGLDVFDAEPADPAHPLWTHPRVLATPHVGGLTEAMFRRSAELFAGNLARWADGRPPEWAVNEPPAPRTPPVS
ncbi:MAG TPA: NAD(P)-dependent oxidoreductase [Pseudonocardia sp.]|jgi:phosphoglycerate dehydrogenase-like enzyme